MRIIGSEIQLVMFLGGRSRESHDFYATICTHESFKCTKICIYCFHIDFYLGIKPGPIKFFLFASRKLIHQLWHMSLSYIPPLVMSVYIHIIKFRSRISEIMIWFQNIIRSRVFQSVTLPLCERCGLWDYIQRSAWIYFTFEVPGSLFPYFLTVWSQ